MVVYLFTFSKRTNSLSAPAPSTGREVGVNLKSPCTMLEPRLEVTFDPTAYNYCYIPDWDRYYYLTEQAYERGIWEVRGSVDVLASWASYIRSTSAQVIFSSSDYNLDLIDNRIPAAGPVIRNVTNVPFAGALAGAQTAPSGSFALTALDSTGIWATGAATTYFMTYQQMQNFARDLLAASAFEAIKQFFDNPMDAVIDCYYLPINAGEYVALTAERAIDVAGYTFPTATGRSGQATNMANKAKRTTIAIDWPYTDFRRLSPYTSIELFVPFCGSALIPPESVYQHDQIFIDYGVDVSTGAVEAIAYVKETVLAELSGNCRIQLPIGQTQARVDSILGTAGGIITGIGGAASGNVALGASGVLSAIGSAISPSTQKTMGGAQGSILGAVLGNDVRRWQQIRLSVTSHETNANPDSIRSIMGNCNGDVLSLGALSGYCQTSGASVNAPATDREINEINRLLDGGVYL